MPKEQLRLILPNHHEGDIGKSFLARILQQAQVSKDEWEEL